MGWCSGSDCVRTRHRSDIDCEREIRLGRGVLISKRGTGVGRVSRAVAFPGVQLYSIGRRSPGVSRHGNRTRGDGGLRCRGRCVPDFVSARVSTRTAADARVCNEKRRHRGFLLLLAGVVTGVIMIAVGSELAHKVVLSRWI